MQFLRRHLLSLIPAAAIATRTASAQTEQPARLDLDLVKDWVAKAHTRNIDAMKELLKKEPGLMFSSWNLGAGDWESALQAAAHTGSRDMALWLIDQGARLDLMATAMLGQLPTLKAACEAFPKSIETRGAHGIPLLSHAIYGAAQAKDVLHYLLDKGADVNARHGNGFTPLMAAVQNKQPETVRLLLSKGADPKIKANAGQTALSLSAKAANADITAVLKEAGATE
jgi:hypothetical protein